MRARLRGLACILAWAVVASPCLADEGWLPLFVPMGALPWHSQTKSVFGSLSLCPPEDRAPFSPFWLVVGLGVLTPIGAITSLKSVQLAPP